jgi:uncharacterized protein (DUF2062 family)
MFGGIGVARLVAGLAAGALAAIGPFAPAVVTLSALLAVLLALNVFEALWVASSRPILVIRTGRGAIPNA